MRASLPHTNTHTQMHKAATSAPLIVEVLMLQSTNDDFLGSCNELWGLHAVVWVASPSLICRVLFRFSFTIPDRDVAIFPNRKWPTNLDLTLKPVTSQISMLDLFIDNQRK